jgi:hypothetical protein
MKDIRPVPGTFRYHLHTVKAVVICTCLWLIVGFVLIAMDGPRPTTLWGWLLWCAVAPVFCLLGEAIFEGLGFLFSKIPPTSWLIRWVRCEDGEGDPLLRFAALAFGFLFLFLLALRMIYD